MAERRSRHHDERDRDREREREHDRDRRRHDRDELALAPPAPQDDLTEVRYQLNVIKEAASKSIRDKEDELRRLEEENGELKQMLAEQAAHTTGGDRRTRVDGLNQRLRTVKSELEGIEAERQKLRFQLDSALNEKQELEDRVRKSSEGATSLEAEVRDAKHQTTALEKRLRDLEVEISNPMATRGESATAARLHSNLNQVKSDQERLRSQLRDAKDESDRKKSQLKDLHRRLKRAREILGRRDQQLRDAQLRSANAMDYALGHNRGADVAVADSKEAQISILTEKAHDTDRLLDELLDFVRAYGPRDPYQSGDGGYRADYVPPPAPAPAPVAYSQPTYAAASYAAPVSTTYYAAQPATTTVYVSSPSPVAYSQPASPYRQPVVVSSYPSGYSGEQRWASKADALAQDLDKFKAKVKGHPVSQPY